MPENRLLLGLAPLAEIDPCTLEALSAAMSLFFSIAVTILAPVDVPPGCYSQGRKQYHAGILLDALSSLHSEAHRVMGVTTGDLYLPIFTHLYGEAQMPGRAAVVSLFRLTPAEPDEGSRPPPENGRLFKITAHEFLHTLGVDHCRVTHCLMRPVIALSDLDSLPPDLCRSCRNLCEQAMRDQLQASVQRG